MNFYVLYITCMLSATTCGIFGYKIDDSFGVGRQFDGIGAISGGGVSCLSDIKVQQYIFHPILHHLCHFCTF
jgi:hypothetical protein